MTDVYVFGNPDLEFDSLPLRILPRLKEVFPDVVFHVKDPNEEWPPMDRILIIDTVMGIDEPMRFDSLKAFADVPRVTVHDFDALTNLRLMGKLGMLGEVRIVGLPPHLNEEDGLSAAERMLRELLTGQ